MNWIPTNFLARSFFDFRAQRRCKQLASEANPQNRLPFLQEAFDQRHFVSKKRILRVFIHTHWAAHNDQPSKIASIFRDRFSPIGAQIFIRMTGAAKRALYASK